MSNARLQYDEGEGVQTDATDVIKYLRREKDIVETKLEMSIQESERIKLQLEHTARSLEETRFMLEEERTKGTSGLESEKHHRELLEKIEQINLLRESNITLRTQLENTQKKVVLLEQQVQSVTAKLEPLKSKVGELEGEVAERIAQNKTLAADNDKWKGRAQQILEKYEVLFC